jgi:hypothetical protein
MSQREINNPDVQRLPIGAFGIAIHDRPLDCSDDIARIAPAILVEHTEID